jgi:hypothetical protein
MSLTAAQLRELFSYDPETGIFTRLKTTCWCAKAGMEVGSDDMHGYKTVRIGKASYKIHRLAWLYVHGEWPKGDVDHLNGQRSDNRIANLRDVPRQTNLQNCRQAASHNLSTGVLGVYPTRSGKRFEAAISINNRKCRIGVFDTVDEAHAAYIEAKRSLHAGCTI